MLWIIVNESTGNESADKETGRGFAAMATRFVPSANSFDVKSGAEVRLSVEQAQAVLVALWEMLPESQRPVPRIPPPR